MCFRQQCILIICIIIILILVAFIMYKRIPYETFIFKKDVKSNENKHKIILYYMPWCGACKAFKPMWNEFEKYVNENMKEIEARHINCEEEKCEKINKYPTVILYTVSGKEIEFQGERTVEKLKKFIKDNVTK